MYKENPTSAYEWPDELNWLQQAQAGTAPRMANIGNNQVNSSELMRALLSLSPDIFSKPMNYDFSSQMSQEAADRSAYDWKNILGIPD
jgi:hypothetical protein